MKFTAITLLAAIAAVATAQSSSGDGIITVSPIPGSTESTVPTSTEPVTSATSPATTSATSAHPSATSSSVSVPTVSKTTTGTLPSPTKPNGGNALSSTPAKVLLAIGGGAVALAQFL